MYGQPVIIPKERLDEDIPEIERRQRYISKSIEAAWKRWEKKGLRSLCERHNMMYNIKAMKIEVGNVVLIRGKEKNK